MEHKIFLTQRGRYHIFRIIINGRMFQFDVSILSTYNINNIFSNWYKCTSKQARISRILVIAWEPFHEKELTQCGTIQHSLVTTRPKKTCIKVNKMHNHFMKNNYHNISDKSSLIKCRSLYAQKTSLVLQIFFSTYWTNWSW